MFYPTHFKSYDKYLSYRFQRGITWFYRIVSFYIYIVAFIYQLPVNFIDIHKIIVILYYIVLMVKKIVNNYYKNKHIEYCVQGIVFEPVKCVTTSDFENYILRLILLLLFAHFQSGIWGTESLRKITKLTCGKMENRAQMIGVQKSCSSPFYFSITILI